jgi:hypothetical protein
VGGDEVWRLTRRAAIGWVAGDRESELGIRKKMDGLGLGEEGIDLEGETTGLFRFLG